MEKTITNNLSSLQLAVYQYCLTSSKHSLYTGHSIHDVALATHMKKSNSPNLHLRLDIERLQIEVFIPVANESIIGIHDFTTPIFTRHKKTLKIENIDELKVVNMLDFDNLDFIPLSISGSLEKWSQNTFQLSSLVSDIFIIFDAYIEVHSERNINDWLTSFFNKLFTHCFYTDKKTIISYEFKDIGLSLDSNGFPYKIFPLVKVNQSTASKKNIEHTCAIIVLEHLIPLCATIKQITKIPEIRLLKIIYDILYNIRNKQNKQNLFVEKLLLQRQFVYDNNSGKRLNVFNVFHEIFVEEQITQPPSLDYFYTRYFDEQKIEIKMRPFNIEKDLVMVHKWFHLEHAKKIWQMNWNFKDLEFFYRTLLPSRYGHSYIGEINGVPSFNFEVYWPSRDIVGDYYNVHPQDYGTHLFIVPESKDQKFSSQTTQCIIDWVFSYSKVNRLIGEGSVESLSALLNKIHVGFKLKKVIEMPHKKANLNICYRPWFWEKFPNYKPALTNTPI